MNQVEHAHLTRLGRWLEDQPEHAQGLSGFRLLHTGIDAFVARAVLMELAEKTLDLQYYIFKHDASGALIVDGLIAAAERGVAVRLLLDDMGTFDKNDEAIASLDAHPNIEIRLFNPYVRRGAMGKLRAMSNRFSRINRRMHNKMLLADNSAVVLGGRNIGDEYFDLATVNFQDIDLLGLGAIAEDSAAAFDAYWKSEFAVQVTDISAHDESREIVFRAQRKKLFGPRDKTIYKRALEDAGLAKELRDRAVRLRWARGQLLFDPPEKLSAPPDASSDKYLGVQLTRHAKATRSELLVVSPYFVPGPQGVEFFGRRRADGAEIEVLTNSLAATDAWIVHAGYKKYRRPLLQNGVRIHELKPEAQSGAGVKGGVGYTRSSLHGKTFVFDRTSVFVGSLNIDPRSIRQNTECGILVESAELAVEMAELFESWASPDLSYELRLVQGARGPVLLWVCMENGVETVYTSEPHAGRLRRLGANVMAFFPIEAQI